jgi:hypothetical protein
MEGRKKRKHVVDINLRDGDDEEEDFDEEFDE